MCGTMGILKINEIIERNNSEEPEAYKVNAIEYADNNNDESSEN